MLLLFNQSHTHALSLSLSLSVFVLSLCAAASLLLDFEEVLLSLSCWILKQRFSSKVQFRQRPEKAVGEEKAAVNEIEQG